MLRGIYAPSDFTSRDLVPGISAQEKLKVIAASPVIATPDKVNDKVYDDSFSLTLPYTDGGFFLFGISRMPEMLFTDHISVGDEALYGHGIGTRLLKAACRYAVERDRRVKVFSTGWARLGLVNTAIRVFGEQNVAIEHGERYGWNSDKELAAIFDENPPKAGEKYLVGGIEANIDPSLALTWEAPQYCLPNQSIRF